MILYHSLTVATEFDKCVQMLIDLPNCMMEKFRDRKFVYKIIHSTRYILYLCFFKILLTEYTKNTNCTL